LNIQNRKDDSSKLKVAVKKDASQPISRVLSWTVIRLALQSPAGSSSLPGPDAGRALVGPYLALLQVGFTIASSVTRPAVRSYRTFSPLPLANEWRFPFCCTFRRLSPPRRYLALCPMEPGLSSPSFEAATAWPTRAKHTTGNPSNRKFFLSVSQPILGSVRFMQTNNDVIPRFFPTAD